MTGKDISVLLEQLTEIAGVIGGLVAGQKTMGADVAEVKGHLARLNGTVASQQQAIAIGEAWQKAHRAEHQQVVEEERETTRNRIEWLKAAPPALEWVFRIGVIVLLLMRLDVPSPIVRAVDIPIASPHPGPAASATATATVHPTATARAAPTAIEGFGDTDRDYLARLCVVEVRNMAEKRADACLSVISTVLTRMSDGQMSDGTVAGTITRNCFPDTIACQFPAYAVNGCEGILPTACPHSYPEDIAYFLRVVDRYFDDGERGSCTGYLFYWLLKAQDCRIESASGNFTNWYKKAER